jgi:hypothetical protein
MKQKKPLPVIGWREWLSLPDLGIQAVKAKIDTGARSSAIHAFDIKSRSFRGRTRLRFKVHPYQHSSHETWESEAYVIDQRQIRNSGGSTELRYVILTTAQLDEYEWPIELTRTTRDVMGFRMLLGRQALRGRFLIDPRRSFLLSRALKETLKIEGKK